MIPGLRREGKRMELSKSRSLEEMPYGAKTQTTHYCGKELLLPSTLSDGKQTSHQ